jgi:formylmethanofuran dehydrogenase subunit E
MPLGLRAAEAAMQVLGMQHAPHGQLTALVEIDRNHCSTCFADGVQVTTGAPSARATSATWAMASLA